jgi:hypothetical protein
MWLASSFLIGALAVDRGDSVFILLQLSSLVSAAAILVLAERYRGMVCATHAHQSAADAVSRERPVIESPSDDGRARRAG